MRIFAYQTTFIVGLLISSLQAGDFKFDPNEDVKFYLKSKSGEDEVFSIATSETVKSSSFDPSKPSVFSVHGYVGSKNNPEQLSITKFLMDDGRQNVFAVDWHEGANTFNYMVARERVNNVAEVMGTFIKDLEGKGQLKHANLTLIGFSLGAHIVGLAGKRFLDGRFKKIIGLDPAGPLFDVKSPERRLTADSAQYTECIHSGFILDSLDPICQVDIYFNGGTRQPGCENFFGQDNLECSHLRAAEYFTETFTNPKAFYAKRCENLKDAFDKKCNSEPGIFVNDPENEVKRPKGIYHVTTNSKSPFGLGR